MFPPLGWTQVKVENKEIRVAVHCMFVEVFKTVSYQFSLHHPAEAGFSRLAVTRSNLSSAFSVECVGACLERVGAATECKPVTTRERFKGLL